MTTKTTKLIRTIYLYVAVLISLIFTAVGAGRIINTTLKAYIFTEAEKGGYECKNQPPMYSIEVQTIEKSKGSELTTEDQKKQLDALLNDYENWKKDNEGEVCYKRQRAMNYVDSFTMFIVALPICLFHWRVIRRDKKEVDDNNENNQA